MADAPQTSINTDIVMQVLHRTVSTVGIVVVAAFAWVDWVLAHEDADWVMPPEIVGTGQQAVTALVTLWVFTRALKKYGAAAVAAFDGPPGNGGGKAPPVVPAAPAPVVVSTSVAPKPPGAV